MKKKAKADLFYTVEKDIQGTHYVAQFQGISTAVKAIDNSFIEGTSNTSSEKLGDFILKNIIVEPKGLTADDFESLEEFNAVTIWGRDVMNGKFRDKSKPKAGKEESDQ